MALNSPTGNIHNVSSTAPLITLNNLNTLLPKLFDLLHKTSRSLHLNTLESLVAMVHRYPA